MEVHIYKANVKQKWCYPTLLQMCTKGRHVPPSNRRWRRKLTGRWWWVHLAQPSPDQSYSTRRDVVTGGIFLMTQQRHVSKILVLNFHLGILLADWLQESDDGNNSREIYPVTTLSCLQPAHRVISSGTPKPKMGGRINLMNWVSSLTCYGSQWGLMEIVQTQMWCSSKILI